MLEYNEISYSQELLRKSIHLTSLSIPVIYIFIDRQTALSILIPIAVLVIVLDLSSKFIEPVRKLFQQLFGRMLRSHEVKKVYVLNGASWVVISAVICIWIFPKFITVTSFTILIISDLTAALLGRKYGRHPFLDKSLEGTLAFMFSAFAVITIYGIIFLAPWTYFIFGYLASIVGGIMEASSAKLKMDDNLTIPVSIGLVLWVGGYLSDLINFNYINLL
jgi:dolichol kinase